jgi:hypothetical protein
LPVAQQVPSVAGDIAKHCEPAVRLVSRFRHELDAVGPHPFVGGVEILDS